MMSSMMRRVCVRVCVVDSWRDRQPVKRIQYAVP